MNSRLDQLRVFLKGFIDLCSRRRSGIHPSIEKALHAIIAELEEEKTPSLKNLLDFEEMFDCMESKDAHLKYLHSVLKGFRERNYRDSAAGPANSPL